MGSGEDPICFVISPIGPERSDARKWADQTFKHLIRPVAEERGFRALRADQEDRAGIITTHIIQRLTSAELVIADLTTRNANVFYELAVRHVTRKPLVQMIRAEEDIPFDVQGMRTVKFELNDPDLLEAARQELENQVDAVLEEGQIDTPISQAVGQQLALESGDPGQVQLAELASAVQSLTAEVRAGAPVYTTANFKPTAYYGGVVEGVEMARADVQWVQNNPAGIKLADYGIVTRSAEAQEKPEEPPPKGERSTKKGEQGPKPI